MAVAKITEKPFVEEIKEEASFLVTQPELDENNEEVEKLKRATLKMVADALKSIGLFISTDGSNVIGIRKVLGTFECTAVDEKNGKYTFDVPDTSGFVGSTEYEVSVDDIVYLIRTSQINKDSVVFVAVNGTIPFEVGNSYTIVFETSNAVALGKGNTVLAHNAFGAGYNNTIDETGDQTSVSGYGHKVSGKNHTVSGCRNIVSGEANNVSGVENQVDGIGKLVSGSHLIAKMSGNGGIVAGVCNEDVPDAKFILGNGVGTQRKNAMVIDKDGKVIINETSIEDLKAIRGYFNTIYLNDKQLVPTDESLSFTAYPIGDAIGTDSYGGAKLNIPVATYSQIGNTLDFNNGNYDGEYFIDKVQSIDIPVRVSLRKGFYSKQLTYACGNEITYTRLHDLGDYTATFDWSAVNAIEGDNFYFVSEDITADGTVTLNRGTPKEPFFRLYGKSSFTVNFAGISVIDTLANIFTEFNKDLEDINKDLGSVNTEVNKVKTELTNKADKSDVFGSYSTLKFDGEAVAKIKGVDTIIGTGDGLSINFQNPYSEGYMFKEVASFFIPVILTLKKGIYTKDVTFSGDWGATQRLITMGRYTARLDILADENIEDKGDYFVVNDDLTTGTHLVFTRGITQGEPYWDYRIIGKLTSAQIPRLGNGDSDLRFNWLNKRLEELTNAIISLGGNV